jgi:hypothetical protein
MYLMAHWGSTDACEENVTSVFSAKEYVKQVESRSSCNLLQVVSLLSLLLYPENGSNIFLRNAC